MNQADVQISNVQSLPEIISEPNQLIMPNYEFLIGCRTVIPNDPDYLLIDLYHQSDESIVVNKSKFLQRFDDIFGTLFSGFDWKNTLLAGGSILQCLEKDNSNLLSNYSSSDIDLFVYGKDIETLFKNMVNVLDFFKDRLAPNKYFVYNNTFTVEVICGFNRSIQIIGLLYESPLAVLGNFDLSSSQVGFNGSDIVYTDDFLMSMITRIAKRNPLKIGVQSYRVYKALKRGFMFPKNSLDAIVQNRSKYAYSYTQLTIDKQEIIKDWTVDLLEKEFENRQKEVVARMHDYKETDLPPKYTKCASNLFKLYKIFLDADYNGVKLV